jgi:hypothetical protein
MHRMRARIAELATQIEYSKAENKLIEAVNKQHAELIRGLLRFEPWPPLGDDGASAKQQERPGSTILDEYEAMLDWVWKAGGNDTPHNKAAQAFYPKLRTLYDRLDALERRIAEAPVATFHSRALYAAATNWEGDAMFCGVTRIRLLFEQQEEKS